MPASILELDHVGAGYSNPSGGHRGSAACHVPGSVGLAKGAFGPQAIHRIDHVVAALGSTRAGSEPDTLGRGATEDDCFDAAGFEALIEIVAQEFVWSARLLLEKLALARRDCFIDNFAAAG